MASVWEFGRKQKSSGTRRPKRRANAAKPPTAKLATAQPIAKRKAKKTAQKRKGKTRKKGATTPGGFGVEHMSFGVSRRPKKTTKKKGKKAGGASGKKEKRAPSKYNLFMATEIPKVKRANPKLDHKQAFAAAAKNWRTHKK